MATRSKLFSGDHVLICDGAMGTMIHSSGVPIGQSFDEINLSRPEVVEGIHRAYVEAGAEIIETNTFGANRIKLDMHGLGHKTRETNVAGVQIAKRCADGVLVAGSVGPTGRLMQPLGPLSFDDAYDAYLEQIEALCEGGVDLLIIETLQDLREAKAAFLAAKSITDIPVICQMSFGQEGRSMMGTTPEAAAVVLSALGADCIGANCGTGPQDMLSVINAMASVTSAGLSAQPNAGLPRYFEGRLMYLTTPDYMADFARQFMEAGAVLLGGCCGTTPEHIRAIASSVKGMTVVPRTVADVTRLAGRSMVIEIGSGQPVLMGNRLQRSKGEVSLYRVQDEVKSQSDQGAGIIYLDCETADVAQMVELAQTGSDVALCLACRSASVLEQALRSVEGRAVVVWEDTGSTELLPLAKKYGAVVMAQTGGLSTAGERLEAARRAVETVEKFGLDKSSLLINAGSASADGVKADEETMEALRTVKSTLGVRTAVEYGQRVECGVEAILESLAAGADVLIADPGNQAVREARKK